MDYKSTLKVSMEAFPTLYLNEEEVLHHYFFVIGNGYEWENGELVEFSYKGLNLTIPEEQIEYVRNCRRKELLRRISGGDPFFSGRLIEDFKEELDRIDSPDYVEQEKKKAVEYRKEFNLKYDKIYPLCQYSRICCLPDDIKPDWLAAAKRALAYAETLQRTEVDNSWLKKAARRTKELEDERR